MTEAEILAYLRRRPTKAVAVAEIIGTDDWDAKADAIRLLALLEDRGKVEVQKRTKPDENPTWRYVKPKDQKA